MKDLEDELIEMVRIFDYCGIPKERQRYIICNGGVSFEFGRDDRVRLNCFRFAKLLEMAKKINEDFDANKMLKDIYQGHDYPYEKLVKLFIQLEDEEKEKQKSIGERK